MSESEKSDKVTGAELLELLGQLLKCLLMCAGCI